MSLLDTLRLAVKTADSVTRSIQATVQFWHYTSSDTYGAKLYTPDLAQPGIPLLAIVDWARKMVRTPSGEMSVTRATITFLDPAKLALATDGQGVGNDDVIYFPDGDTGPILDISGFIDAGTGLPFATEAMIG